MSNKKVLISGAGVAGMTLAYFLRKQGFDPIIIEKAKSLRDGGYMIDFFSSGVHVAKEMGIEKGLAKRNHGITKMIQYNPQGEKTHHWDLAALRDLMKGGFYNFLRTDLVEALYDAVDDDIPVRFDTTITAIDDSDDAGVQVTFDDGSSEMFAFIVGADGIHSNVRSLLYTEEEVEQPFLGYYVAAWEHQHGEGIEKDALVTVIEPKRQVSSYFAEGKSYNSLFVVRSDEQLGRPSHKEQIAFLRRSFDGFVSPVPALLDIAEKEEKIYFDAVVQVKIKGPWHKKRAVLVGDAAYCMTLLSGQGASMAMVGAYVLAEELGTCHGDYEAAFRAYEERLRPDIKKKQKKAVRNAASYLPASRLSLALRNVLAPLFFSKWGAKLIIKQLGAENFFKK